MGHSARRDDLERPHSRVAGRIRGALPVVGTFALVAYMVASTDLEAVGTAFAAANWVHVGGVMVFGTLVTWLADSASLVWLLRRVFGPPASASGGTDDPLAFPAICRLKAASYVVNIVNYHAATLGMAWVIARRRGVGFVAAASALAVLSWLDLVALALLVSGGLALAPSILGDDGDLHGLVRVVSFAIPLGAAILVAIARGRAHIPLIASLSQAPAVDAGKVRRGLHVFAGIVLTALAPLGSLSLAALSLGICIRLGFVLLYVVLNHQLMVAFGMTPTLTELCVLLPVMTVVGVVPLSVSGIGTTQILARTLYARFVPAGLAVAPVIDAYTTALIIGFIAARGLLALPVLSGVLAELRSASAVDPDRL